MRLNEVREFDGPPIDGYGPGFFRVGGQVIRGAALVTETGARGWAGLEDAQPLLDLVGDIDVIFIGTGAEIAHIPQELRDAHGGEIS